MRLEAGVDNRSRNPLRLRLGDRNAKHTPRVSITRLSTSMPSACTFMIANRTLELTVLDTLPD